jgi:hypothetical protein
MSIKQLVSIAALACLASACGSAATPAQQLTNSKASVSAAEAVGAENVPKARYHLKLARDQIATGEALIGDGNMAEADLVLQRAQADAELALSLSRETSIRAEAAEAKKKLEKLRAGE